MGLSLVTAPVVEPLSLAEAKLQCRVDHADEDSYILGLVRTARESVETYTGMRLLTQTWDLKLDAFPCWGEIELPIRPVASVTSISYVDWAGDSQTWSTSEYQTDIPSGPQPARTRIAPRYGYSYPSTYPAMNAVTIRFVAGFGPAATSVPNSLKQAIALLVDHWWQNREAVVVSVGGTATLLPMGVEYLLRPYRDRV